jgi:hypothetical protein
LRSFLKPPVGSSRLGPNILLGTMLSNSHVCVSLVSETKFHTRTKQGNIIVLCTLIFTFLDRKTKDFEVPMIASIPRIYSDLNSPTFSVIRH